MSTITTPAPGGARTNGAIRKFVLEQIHPAPENEAVYHAVTPESVSDLVESIQDHGILEPLIVTRDFYIVSGHRRHFAARLAGLATVPCKVLNIARHTDLDRFVRLLRECNRQRTKAFDEIMREEAISYDPEDCYKSLIEARQEELNRHVEGVITLRTHLDRAKITPAKYPLLNAVVRVLNKMQKWYPLTVRQIHYNLLNDPPLIHASKPDSTYRNDKARYRACVDICARARLTGALPWKTIADETRPVLTWNTFASSQTYLRHQLKNLFKGYWRDLLQSQPDHIEIMVEKNTSLSVVRDVAMRYCIPVTSGRGFSSLSPRNDIVQRYRDSHKNRLVVLCLSDFDPHGEEITHSFARTLRDDWGVDEILPVKVCITSDQVDELKLPHAPDSLAKPGSPNYDRFVEQYGTDVYELEAMTPDQLSEALTDAIDSVIDTDLFNKELAAEKEDSASLQRAREGVKKFFRGSSML